jgi:hypothetical protein
LKVARGARGFALTFNFQFSTLNCKVMKTSVKKVLKFLLALLRFLLGWLEKPHPPSGDKDQGAEPPPAP